MYYVLSVGVNNSPDCNPLRFAEKDAEDIGEFYRGALGPTIPNKRVEVLTGSRADISSLANALLMVELARPEFFVFFFSGHGSKTGISVANGEFSYDSLVQYVEAIGADSSVVILDTCHAAAYTDFLGEVAGVGGVGIGWLETLANATPGSRLMLSTGRNKTSAEGGEVDNGHFTHSLIQALQRGKGDIPSNDGTRFVSDLRAFNLASLILRQTFGGSQKPVERYLTGDLPMSRSQNNDPVGDAEIIAAHGSAGVSLQVDFRLEYRRSVDTMIECVLQDSEGNEIDKKIAVATPSDSFSSFDHKFEFAPSKVLKAPLVSFQLRRQRYARLNWVLTIKDVNGVELDSKVVPLTYSKSY